MKRWIVLSCLLLAACGPVSPPRPPVDHTTEWTATCRSVVQDRRRRDITDTEMAVCIEVARQGGQVEDLRLWVETLSPEPIVLPPALQRIRVDGRFFVTDAGTFRPRFASTLAVLARTPEERAAVLDEDVALGFNGFRVFGGDLGWANQSPASARATFPTLLEEAAARGLYVYLSALTGTSTGFDAEAHLREMATACAAAVNCLLEIANEPYHPTQSSVVQDPISLLALARRAVPDGVPYALGAAPEDEPDPQGRYAFDGGAFSTAHLDRGRDKWNQVRRLREIENISAVTHKPAISGEPIGAAEQSQPGRRESDPAFFFAMGALCRGFEIGCVFHSEDGLNARPLGPNQRACAEAFNAGWRSIPTEERLVFKNATWADSPVRMADFDKVVRAYTFVAGLRAWTVLVGLSGDPRLELQLGWQIVGTVATRPGVEIVELVRP